MKIKSFAFLLVTFLVALLFGCSISEVDDPQENDFTVSTPEVDDTNIVEIQSPILPFDETIDISHCFMESDDSFDESKTKEGLVCDHIDSLSYVCSNENVMISVNDIREMAVHCTWASAAKKVYIGFIDVASNDLYTLSATGGALSGVIDLSEMPESEYQIVMYSSDNENVIATMLYQFR